MVCIGFHFPIIVLVNSHSIISYADQIIIYIHTVTRASWWHFQQIQVSDYTSIFFLKEARTYSFLCNVWQIKLLSIISMASCSDTIWRLRVRWSAQLLVAGILSQMNNIDKIPVVQINPFLYFKDAVRPSCSDEKIYKYQSLLNTFIV